MVSAPVQSGKVRSSKTATTLSRPSSSRPSDKVWRQVRRHRANRVSDRASLTRRVSPGLSSISSTGSASSLIDVIRSQPRRQLDDRQPEILDPSDHFDELEKIDRLHNVAISVQIVAREDVRLRIRGSQDYDRDAAQNRVRLNLAQHLA